MTNKRKAEEDADQQHPSKKQKLSSNAPLLAIGNDNLANIFSYLKMRDLVHDIQITCKSFAHVLFTHRECWKHILFRPDCAIPEKYDAIISRLDVAKCSQYNMQNMKDLVQLDYANKEHIKWFASTLERIKVVRGKFPAIVFSKVKQLKLTCASVMEFSKFPNLRKIHLHSCMIEGATRFFDGAQSLEYIRIKRGMLDSEVIITQDMLPKLKKIKILLQPDPTLPFVGIFTSIVELDIDNDTEWYDSIECPNLEIVHLYSTDLCMRLDKFKKLHTVHLHGIVDTNISAEVFPATITTLHLHESDIFKMSIAETNISSLYVTSTEYDVQQLMVLFGLCGQHGGLTRAVFDFELVTGELNDKSASFPPAYVQVHIQNWVPCGIIEMCAMHLFAGKTEPDIRMFDKNDLEYSKEQRRCLVNVFTSHVLQTHLLNAPKHVVDNWKMQRSKETNVELLQAVISLGAFN